MTSTVFARVNHVSSACLVAFACAVALDVSIEGNALHIVYSGTVDKDTMKGSVRLGDLGEGTFTAKKRT